MSVNDKPCRSCSHYDRIVVGDGTKETRHGWCAVRSIYPAQEGPGQVFPLGVKRAAPGVLASPFVVVGAETVTSCTAFRSRS
jgi:hypothetical protein